MIDFDERVRAEAYRIWEQEGRPHGQHERHWGLAVERVLSEVETQAVKAPVIPLPLQRVVLSARLLRKSQKGEPPLRASA